MSHLAFYLFYRWEIVQEQHLRFQQRQQWYNIHLFKGERADWPISYETQLEWISKAFARANLASLKKTHAGRAQGAKHAELAGVNEA